MKTALLLIDFVNEIVDPDGKLAGKGYASFVARHDTLARVSATIERARANGIPIVFVRLGFSPDYRKCPKNSPLFGRAAEFGALKLGTWATDIHPRIAPLADDIVLTKHRVSAFFGTTLDEQLRLLGITHLIIGGVATDLAVESAARDAHDRDYRVTIASDLCAAASDEDHASALTTLTKIATVTTSDEIEELK